MTVFIYTQVKLEQIGPEYSKFRIQAKETKVKRKVHYDLPEVQHTN